MDKLICKALSVHACISKQVLARQHVHCKVPSATLDGQFHQSSVTETVTCQSVPGLLPRVQSVADVSTGQQLQTASVQPLMLLLLWLLLLLSSLQFWLPAHTCVITT
jgi:hypothetical protein